MSYKLKINITKEILERSKFCNYIPGTDRRISWHQHRDNPSLTPTINCAIALAVRDIFPLAQVEEETIEVYTEDNSDFPVLINLPGKAGYFIRNFDINTPEERVSMKPISFEIDVPDQVIESINIDEVKDIISKKDILELIEVD